MRTPVKKFRISAEGFYRSQNQLRMGTFEEVFVNKATAQTAQFWGSGNGNGFGD